MTEGLQAERICALRGGSPVLDAVSFQMNPGEIVAVIGPNGAGKTSLLEAALGFLPVSSGAVSFNAQPLRTLHHRARVFSFLAEDAEPPAEVRVAALLSSAARAVARHGLADVLEGQLGLRPLRQAFAGELSRGEKRRSLLYGALCTIIDNVRNVPAPSRTWAPAGSVVARSTQLNVPPRRPFALPSTAA